jgi:transcriptional repressor NrdR
MKCPRCGNETRVSRTFSEDLIVNRVRKCTNCSFQAWTLETINPKGLKVRKRDRYVVAFDIEKLRKSIKMACQKLEISDFDQENIVRRVIDSFALQVGTEKIIESQEIGEEVLKHLKDLHDAAFVRYASYYMYQKDPKTFKKMKDQIMRTVSN